MKRIEVSFGFAALACVLLWLNWRVGVWFLLGIVCHELGHLLAMGLCRVPCQKLLLRLSGAVIETQFCRYGQELVCALAGPVASILAAVIGLRVEPGFAVVSGLLAAVNLLPLYPLDGGRVLRAALLLTCGTEKTIGVMRILTYGVCGSLMLLACWLTAEKQAGLWPVFVALVILCRVGKASLSA